MRARDSGYARMLHERPRHVRAKPGIPSSRPAARRRARACPSTTISPTLDRLIAAHDYFKQDKVIPAIGAGEASQEVVQQIALEFYYLGKWMTPEFAVLIANAPDAYAFTMEDSTHYHHWAQNFADETGYLRDPNHVRHEGRVLPPARPHRRRTSAPTRRMPETDRDDLHDALLHPPLVRGGPRGVRLRGRAGRRRQRLREDALRGAGRSTTAWA